MNGESIAQSPPRNGRPHLDMRITFGNVLSIIVIIVGMLGGYYTMQAEINQNQKEIMRLADEYKERADEEAALRSQIDNLNINIGKLNQRLKDFKIGTE